VGWPRLVVSDSRSSEAQRIKRHTAIVAACIAERVAAAFHATHIAALELGDFALIITSAERSGAGERHSERGEGEEE